MRYATVSGYASHHQWLSIIGAPVLHSGCLVLQYCTWLQLENTSRHPLFVLAQQAAPLYKYVDGVRGHASM